MPRVARRPITGAELASPALVAAATPVKTGTTTKKVAEATGWKKEAWDFYDTVGELSYVCDWLGDALSRARLIASDIAEDGRPTGATADNTVASIVADIAGGPAGQSTMLGRLATNLTIVGEAWVAIITRDTDLGSVEEWHILSADEMTTRGSEILLTLGDDTSHVFNPDVDLLTRVHIPHPRNARESAAATRSALEPLRELAGTAASIRGATRSRLAGNGILLLPQEISMPMAAPPTGDPDAPGLPAPEQPAMEDRQVTAQDVMGQLQQVMTMAIQDPSSAAAMVPIILKAPGEHLDKVRHITLESEVTEMSLRTRDSAIRRLALSLKVPPEMLLGLSQGNHWSAWAIDASAVNTHVVPMLTVICDALTDAVLRPLLARAGHKDPNAVTIWFDVSDLANGASRTENAVAAFDRGAISAVTLRQSLGFGDDDAPSDEMSDSEKRALAIQMVSKAPSLLPMLAPIIGLDIDTTAVPRSVGAPVAQAPVAPPAPPKGA